MLVGLKEWLKKSDLAVKIYENIVMLFTYIQVNMEFCILRRRFPQKNIEKIKKLKNIHCGERCFVVGTGPSLTVEILDQIKNEVSIAVNSAYMAYDKTDWRPNYYLVTDDHAFKDLGDGCYKNCTYEAFFLGTECKDFIPNVVPICMNCAHLFLIGTVWNKLFPRLFPIAKYSKDISKVIYGGKTVVYSAIQIMAYMGFKEIYLIGVDCNYKKSLNHAEFVEGSKDCVLSKKRADSMSKGMILQFREMSKRLPKDVHVYNLSEIGNLDAFPRKKISQLGFKDEKDSIQ